MASDCSVRLEKVRIICRLAVAEFPLKEIYDRHNQTMPGLSRELMDPSAVPIECTDEDEYLAILDAPTPADPDEDLFLEGDEEEPALEDVDDLEFSEVPDGCDPSVLDHRCNTSI